MNDYFHYTMCGLENVFLENGYRVEQTDDGEFVSIEDMDGLHRVIATDLASKHGRLAGKELRFLRSMLRMSQQKLADLTGAQRGTVTRWENDDSIPVAVEQLVRALWVGKSTGCPVTVELLEEWQRADEAAYSPVYTDTGSGWKRAA